MLDLEPLAGWVVDLVSGSRAICFVWPARLGGCIDNKTGNRDWNHSNIYGQ